MAIVGFWATPVQYRMYDARTRSTQMAFLPQAAYLSPVEIEDMLGMARERFQEELTERGDHQTMPRSQQHEFGPHLRQIEASKRRFKQVGHGRYWVKE